MPTQVTAGKSRAVRWAIIVVVLSVILYLMPLFHIVSLEGAQEEAAAALFDPASYVESFWQGPLLEATDQAVDVADLLVAFQGDFEGTASRYGHRLGLSGHASYLVSGEGTVVAVDDYSVSIALEDGDVAQIVIEIGPVFGNAIRDGSGLLDVSDFPNAQEFNALSAEINRRVEEQVLPQLQAHAAIGNVVRFVGGVDVPDSGGAPASLTVVPVVVEFP